MQLRPWWCFWLGVPLSLSFSFLLCNSPGPRHSYRLHHLIHPLSAHSIWAWAYFVCYCFCPKVKNMESKWLHLSTFKQKYNCSALTHYLCNKKNYQSNYKQSNESLYVCLPCHLLLSLSLLILIFLPSPCSTHLYHWSLFSLSLFGSIIYCVRLTWCVTHLILTTRSQEPVDTEVIIVTDPFPLLSVFMGPSCHFLSLSVCALYITLFIIWPNCTLQLKRG